MFYFFNEGHVITPMHENYLFQINNLVLLTCVCTHYIWKDKDKHTSYRSLLYVVESKIYTFERWRVSFIISLTIDCYWKSIPIDNHTNLHHRLVISYQYQSINWYLLVLIDIDCHRLSISSIGYPGIDKKPWTMKI